MKTKHLACSGRSPADLLGTVWSHRRKGGQYRITETRKGDEVRLTAVTKGRRSTWKYVGLLEFDYEEIETNGGIK